MKVIGYARVSTAEQAAEGVSLDAQTVKVRGFCALHGLDLAGVEEDAGVSAKTLDRPALGRVLAALDAGEVEGLVVAKLDRLSRSVADWNRLIDRHFGDRAGRSLMSVTESIDTRTAGGRMVLNIMMTVAQWERETIVERTRDALLHKRKSGARVGGVPRGSVVTDDGRRSKDGRAVALADDPSERADLAKIADLAREGKGARAIARFMHEQAESARRWPESTIRVILKRQRERATQ